MKSNRLSKTILLIFIVAFLLILPDIIFSFINQKFKLSHDIKVLALIIPLSFGLVINRFKFLSYFCITILCFAQIMQFSSLAYFGNFLSPYSIYLFFREIQDTFQEAGNAFFSYWYIIPLVVIPFWGISYCVMKNKRKSIIGTLILLITFCSFGYKYYNTDRPRFNPNGIRFTIDNSLKAFWGYLVIGYKKMPVKDYKPYEVIDIKGNFEEPVNIIYILGESANYNHMSLFGYKRDTTPELKTLAKQPNVYYTKGISGAICTVASCKFMLNSLREADNPIQAANDTTNLFRLAKTKRFKTFYLSNQTEHLLGSISGVNYIDVLKTKDREVKKSEKIMDDLIFEMIQSQTFTNRNFIVIHQRCVHTPYTKAISKNFKFKYKFSGDSNSMIDEYDNAMLYNDHIISGLFNYFNKQKIGKFYIIWASDHNDLLGENGLFGHGHGTLVPITADIPVIVQSNDKGFLDNFKKIYKPNHYEITKFIAQLLGYEIINPNEDGKTFFISGADFNGKCGHIKYKKDSEKREVIYFNEK